MGTHYIANEQDFETVAYSRTLRIPITHTIPPGVRPTVEAAFTDLTAVDTCTVEEAGTSLLVTVNREVTDRQIVTTFNAVRAAIIG